MPGLLGPRKVEGVAALLQGGRGKAHIVAHPALAGAQVEANAEAPEPACMLT